MGRLRTLLNNVSKRAKRFLGPPLIPHKDTDWLSFNLLCEAFLSFTYCDSPYSELIAPDEHASMQ